MSYKDRLEQISTKDLVAEHEWRVGKSRMLRAKPVAEQNENLLLRNEVMADLCWDEIRARANWEFGKMHGFHSFQLGLVAI